MDYDSLKPTYAIWLLDDVLLADSEAHHHRFSVHDRDRGVDLLDHLAIHLIELPKWRQDDGSLTREDRWIYFFQSAGGWDELPSTLGDPTMRKAMGVLQDISQRERDLARHESRMDQLRVKRIYEKQARAVEEQRQLIEAQELEQQGHQLEQQGHQLEQQGHQLEQQGHQLEQQDQQLAEQAATLAEQEAELARLRAQLQAKGP
ncbi:MAG: PD-(D/E)XK nuclease family transposase [Alphaproteobacteria bacterium]|nr:PD-(D/E)XK nuclease family transposase [Alphaproteobacteria bacterium]